MPSRRNIYAGPSSCYCVNERLGCDVYGVTPHNYMWYLAQIERDLRRGWTYDHSCRIIPMTPDLARARAIYLIALMKKHVGRVPQEVAAEIRRFAERLKLREPVAVTAKTRA